MNGPLLFGWDDQTWKRAFLWAGVPWFPVIDTSKLAPDQWDKLIGVHSKWMAENGDPAGPQGSIIL